MLEKSDQVDAVCGYQSFKKWFATFEEKVHIQGWPLSHPNNCIIALLGSLVQMSVNTCTWVCWTKHKSFLEMKHVSKSKLDQHAPLFLISVRYDKRCKRVTSIKILDDCGFFY